MTIGTKGNVVNSTTETGVLICLLNKVSKFGLKMLSSIKTFTMHCRTLTDRFE